MATGGGERRSYMVASGGSRGSFVKRSQAVFLLNDVKYLFFFYFPFFCFTQTSDVLIVLDSVLDKMQMECKPRSVTGQVVEPRVKT